MYEIVKKCDHWVGDAASLGSGAAKASALRTGAEGVRLAQSVVVDRGLMAALGFQVVVAYILLTLF